MCGGIIVKIILNVLLISHESIGIFGAPIGTLASYFTMASINFYFVIKYVGLHINIIRNFGKPLLSAILSSVFTVLVYRLISSTGHPNMATILSIIVTALIYFIFLFLLRTFTKEDILLLPGGKTIYHTLCKLKLMEEIP